MFIEEIKQKSVKKDAPINNAQSLYSVVKRYKDLPQEYFFVITLDNRYVPIACRIISIGILNRTIVHPREVFASAIADRAAAVFLCHNHPSGNLEPSEEDISLTKRLSNSGDLLGIPVLDHIIITNNGYTSMQEIGLGHLFNVGNYEPIDDTGLDVRLDRFIKAQDIAMATLLKEMGVYNDKI